MKDTLCLILGGGRGTRLYPLTKYRAKPAVPIAGKYRLIDIPISNCLNSGLRRIFILTQFNSESLNRHIFRAYKMDSFAQGFVEILAAEQSMEGSDWFQGSADAVRKTLKHLNDPRLKYIIILSGDQLYKMNLMDFLNFHIAKKADITISCNSVDAKEAPQLGIIGADKNLRVGRFIEKPQDEKLVEDLEVAVEGKKKALASMGIYVFNKDVLFELLSANKKTDFGREIIPDAISKKKTYAYIYDGYWRDIGSIRAFYEGNLAFTDVVPPLNFFDEDWQFFTRPRFLPLSKMLEGDIKCSNIAEGVIIDKAQVIHSIIGLRSRVGAGSLIEDSVLLGNDFYGDPKESPVLGIGKNCRIKRAIIDKNVKMGDNVKIVNEKNLKDFENEYCVIKDSIIIVPKGTVIPSGTTI